MLMMSWALMLTVIALLVQLWREELSNEVNIE